MHRNRAGSPQNAHCSLTDLANMRDADSCPFLDVVLQTFRSWGVRYARMSNCRRLGIVAPCAISMWCLETRKAINLLEQ